MSGGSEDSGEFGAIARWFRPLAGDDPAARGLGDDAAVLTPPAGMDLVFTKDAMVAGVHFFEDDAPDQVARKLARVNLSDLAAMGARPLGYLLAVALPAAGRDRWFQGLHDGLAADQAEFGWHLWGGDTVTTPGPVTLSLTAVGAVPHGCALGRGGAQAGDIVFVSGTIGDAALGLMVRKAELTGLDGDHAACLLGRLSLPVPRMALGAALAGVGTACIDVSDGLFADLGHICETSGVGADIRRDRLPLSPAAQTVLAGNEALWPRLFGGDDYELLFTAPPSARDAVMEAAGKSGTPVAEIGAMVAGDRLVLLNENGEPVANSMAAASSGYTHF